MCGGFYCSKNALAFLNILFLLVSLLLIGVASYAKVAAIITSIEIAGGIIACGLFLFLVAFLGLIAGSKHHQVMLFFYIVILFLLFIIQFSVSIACLALSKDQVSDSIEKIWSLEGNEIPKADVQKNFNCCGWNQTNMALKKNICEEKQYCYFQENIQNNTTSAKVEINPVCHPCVDVVPEKVSDVLEATGGIGLFFSFAEMLGVWLAVRFRNQKDPGANPSQFL